MNNLETKFRAGMAQHGIDPKTQDVIWQPISSFALYGSRNRTLPASRPSRITPDLYEKERVVVTRTKFLFAEGVLQNHSGVIHVKAARLASLSGQTLEVRSHDFH